MMRAAQPIGVFDSGLGGLSVYREIRRHLPLEDVIYYADSAFCPYGTRSRKEIRERCHGISQFLVNRGVKIIVVACNTATSMAIDFLRASFPQIAFVGLEPAVKPAAAMTRSGKVGVLATPRTVAGDRLRWLIETHASGVQVRTTPGNGLVELVEAGTLHGPEVVRAIKPMLDPMLEADVDAVVLGCTHYPFLRDAIQAYVGPDVALFDSGTAIARRVSSMLDVQKLRTVTNLPGAFEMYTSAEAVGIGRVASALLDLQLTATRVPVTGYSSVDEPVRLCEVQLGREARATGEGPLSFSAD